MTCKSYKIVMFQETTESCLAALRMAVVDGKVVCGGGCLETWAATTVTHLITTKAHLLSLHTSASPYHIFKVIILVELNIRLYIDT